MDGGSWLKLGWPFCSGPSLERRRAWEVEMERAKSSSSITEVMVSGFEAGGPAQVVVRLGIRLLHEQEILRSMSGLCRASNVRVFGGCNVTQTGLDVGMRQAPDYGRFRAVELEHVTQTVVFETSGRLKVLC